MPDVTRKVIVTADDFGLTAGINAGIIDAHVGGIVTASSIAAVGGAFDDAVRLAKEHSTLDIGVHLVLDEEAAMVDGLDTLVTPDGRFLDRRSLVSRLLRGAVDFTEVYRCWRWQVGRVFDAGLRPSFLNSHGHLHVWPSLFPTVARIAHEFGIRAVRKPLEIGKPAYGFGRWIKDAAIAATTVMSMRNLRGLRAPDTFRGLACSGRLTTADIRRLVADCPDGVTELMAHPGVSDDETCRRYRTWGYDWDGERRALIAAKSDGLVLTTFAAEFGSLRPSRGSS
jgi:predicted glycoside hydrolase/deacetylase ChbG (UPF0249 family)